MSLQTIAKENDLIISLDGSSPAKISECFHILEITDSRELIFHQDWKESLKETKLLLIPKTKSILKSGVLGLLNEIYLWDYSNDKLRVIKTYENLQAVNLMKSWFYEFLNFEGDCVFNWLMKTATLWESIKCYEAQEFVYQAILLQQNLEKHKASSVYDLTFGCLEKIPDSLIDLH